jgi:N-acetylmuramic acid 6-phosphate etherase
MTTRTDVRYLAFDGGGTATRAALYDADGNAVAQATGGPSNPVEIGVQHCVQTLSQLGGQLLRGCDAAACEVAAGISGARNEELRSAIANGLIQSLGGRRAVVSSDVDALLHANVGDGEGMVVIAGTGSSVIAKTAGGMPRIFGGRGMLFGDVGSAYDITVRALRAAAGSLDGLRGPTRLIEVLPEAAGLREFSELIGWSRNATKDEVAALTPAVIALYREHDDAAYECVVDSFTELVKLAASAARESGLSATARVFVHGGVFDALPEQLTHFELAMKNGPSEIVLPSRVEKAPFEGTRASLQLLLRSPIPLFVSEVLAGTEEISVDLPRTESKAGYESPLDTLTAEEIVARMATADNEAVAAVSNALPEIARLIQRVAGAFNEGGRLIYVGAGTSGRLGVLDASECPPTFGVDPGQVIGIIAGGDAALRSSGEGVEDDEAAAIQDLIANVPGLCNRDVVVGIAASGTTPYARSGLAYATSCGAYTCMLCCNPAVASDADCVIALDTGPEVLPGSTRLKAGTATKLVLNMISTGAMALSGRIFEGYMVGVKPMNAKLRKRAIRIVAALTGLPEPGAAQLLESAGDSISVAVLMARQKITRDTAETRLNEAKGSLRAALDQD